jgi:hypothetical protein
MKLLVKPDDSVKHIDHRDLSSAFKRLSAKNDLDKDTVEAAEQWIDKEFEAGRLHKSPHREIYLCQVRLVGNGIIESKKERLAPVEKEEWFPWYAHYERAAKFMGGRSLFSKCSMDLTAPDTKDTIALQLMRDFTNCDVRSVALLGKTGRGKTWACVAAAASQTSPVLFVTAEMINTAYFQKDNAYDLRRFKNFPVLVIDELGNEAIDKYKRNNDKDPMSEFAHYFEALFSDRHRDQKKTYITSNLDRAQFLERYGERVYSRLNGDGIIMEVIDQNWREPND